jgi:hypothetical protein
MGRPLIRRLPAAFLQRLFKELVVVAGGRANPALAARAFAAAERYKPERD